MHTPQFVRTLTAALALALAAVCQTAFAFPVDLKIGQAALPNSGDATELSALATILGVNVNTLTMDFKYDNNDAEFNVAANPGGGWFIDVAPTAPGYFMLKFGTGGTGATADHFFFQNIGDLDKLVWTDDQVQFLSGGDCGAKNSNACNIGRLSHFVGVGVGGTVIINQVPEPALLALMGVALAGLSLSRRKALRR